jgi:hypothetical protein
MSTPKGRRDLSPDLRVFLTEVSEVVKEYLALKRRKSHKMIKLTKEDEDDDESRRLFSSQ